MECSVCAELKELVPQEYTHCPSNHQICTECFMRMLNICFCNKKYGEIIYTCPMCRNLHQYKNKEMYTLLVDLTGDNKLFTVPHSVCQTNMQIPKLIRYCEFKHCGCRDQRDLEISPEVREAFEDLKKRMIIPNML